MFANRFTAVIDACVLCSPLKRNLILSLAEAELYRIRWSEELLDETEKAIAILLNKRGCEDAGDRAKRARLAMSRAFVEATVADYESMGDKLGKLPDEGDRHVIAAAIKTKADIIVTENLKDFPAKKLASYGMEAKSSDEFIADAIDLSPSRAISAIKTMRDRFNRPEKTPEMFILDMERIGLTLSADQLRDSVELI